MSTRKMKIHFYTGIIFQIILLNAVKTEDDFSKCGINDFSNANLGFGSKYDREKNPVGHWPWMASIGFIDKNGVWDHQCGATLISDRHFLTAAHCVDVNHKVRIGDFNLLSDIDDRNTKKLEILQMYVHPDYDGKSAYFDLAILETKPIHLSRTILPICLPETSSEDIHKYDDRSVELIGWGSTESRGYSLHSLKRLPISVFPNSLCNYSHSDASERKEKIIREKVPQLFQNHLICAGSPTDSLGACNGDSGGPLMAKNHATNQWFQIATVHGKIGNCEDSDYPAIFVRLDDPKVLKFITSSIFQISKGYTKMLVGVGVDNSIEIVDLNTPETTCQNLPDFPQFPYFAVGGLINYGIPIICGSQYVNIENIGTFRNKCLKLENGAWTLSHNLTDRFSTGIIESPFRNKPKGLYILGAREYGSQRGTSTDHLLTYDGVEDVLPTFPLIIHDHCFVLINSTTVMVIGGRDSTDQDYQDQFSKRTYLLNTENSRWVEGPSLRFGRRSHSCGRIRTGPRSTSIIVVGGYEADIISWKERPQFTSTEILNENMDGWYQGPDLPFGIADSAIVEDSNGGVILVGGNSQKGGILNTLFRLSHSGSEWEELPQKLKKRRNFHVSFLIPDEIVNCTRKN